MRILSIPSLSVALLLSGASAWAVAPVTVVHADAGHCALQLNPPAPQLVDLDYQGQTYQQIKSEGLESVAPVGTPDLPAAAFILEIPATSDISYTLDYQSTILKDVDLLPAQEVTDPLPEELVKNEVLFGNAEFYPPEIVKISDPAVMRGHRLVQVSVTPYQYNPVTRELRVLTNLQLDFQFTGENPVNQVTRVLPPAPSFEKILQAQVINYSAMNAASRDYDPDLGTEPILYICNTAGHPYLNNLLEWKRQRGHHVYLADQGDMNLTSYSSVRSYIQNAYDNWADPPVYVVLVGDPNSCDFGDVATDEGWGGHYDHDYGCLDGNDILADVFVGRMSVNNITQLQNVVYKQLRYEQDPYMGNTAWFTKAHLVADDSQSGMSLVFLSENLKYMLETTTIPNVTTCYHYQGCDEVNSISNAVNNGVLYLNYRGYWGMSDWTNSDADALDNYFMLPFVVTITCGTGDFDSDGLSEGFYRTGTVGSGGGAVAAIGTATTGTNTRCNNVVDMGIFGGIFNLGLETAGAALVQGKLELWRSYATVDPDQVNYFSWWNNLMGDASLQLRTGVPVQVSVEHPASLAAGAASLPVVVTSGGSPVPGAVVTFYKYGSFQIKGLTDASGRVVLPLDGALTSGSAWLTVSKRDLYPYQQEISVENQDLVLDVAASTVSETTGNGDGILNPGETVNLTVSVINNGTATTAQNVTGVLSSSDPRVIITQADGAFGDLAPGAQAAGSPAFVFSLVPQVDPELPSTVDLVLDISSDQGDFTGVVHLEVQQPLLFVNSLTPDPTGNGVIEREETAELFITLDNFGTVATGNCTAVLTTSSPYLNIVAENSSYASIAPNDRGTNITAFQVEPLPSSFIGEALPLTVTLTGPDGYINACDLEITVGTPGSHDPQGPVGGYYCFDSGDVTYSMHPEYAWVEISTSGTQIPLTDYNNQDDDSYTVDLPFTFRYWGESYDQITVCSNGWLAMGDQASQVNYRNYPIPSGSGPGGMVAPFWDDLRNSSGSGTTGKVYYYYDAAGHRFIVQWNQMTQVGPDSPQETFEVILYDQGYLGTNNGDILFQYAEVHNNTNSYSSDVDYATVGIESWDQTEGLQYTYLNDYDVTATPLTNGLAILYSERRNLVDVYPPAVTCLNPQQISYTEELELSFAISDYSGVVSAQLYWSTDSVNFNTQPLENQGAGVWSTVIPGPALGSTLYYYVYAVDGTDDHNAGNSQVFTLVVGVWEDFLMEDVESGQGSWTHSSAAGWNDQWHITTQASYSPTHSWKCGDTGTGDYANHLDAYLITPEMELTAQEGLTLTFRHRIDAEVSGMYPDSANDGGIVEITTNGGATWQQLLPETGYNKHFRFYSGGGNPATHPFPGGIPCYSGNFDWQEARFNLDAFSGHTAQIRFRFGSDNGGVDQGWFLDDIQVRGFTIPDTRVVTAMISYYAPQALVNWEEISGAQGYRIYRSTEPYSGFELVEDTPNLYYLDDVGNSPKYFYRVTWY